MPRRDGFEVLEHLKTDPAFARIPVVVLTASDRPEDITAAYDRGTNAYLTKPRRHERIQEELGALTARAVVAPLARPLRTGQPLRGTRTLRIGWAKVYADGALGSRTAALFAPITCGELYTRIVQRLLSFLTMRTRQGDLYPVDMRLRPSGNQGALVASFEEEFGITYPSVVDPHGEALLAGDQDTAGFHELRISGHDAQARR